MYVYDVTSCSVDPLYRHRPQIAFPKKRNTPWEFCPFEEPARATYIYSMCSLKISGFQVGKLLGTLFGNPVFGNPV